MKKYALKISVNGEEYVSSSTIKCESSVDKIDNYTILVDDKIEIKFNEYIVQLIRVG